MIVILDNVRSAHNVGSIFRTADAAGGVERVILCGVTPGPRDRFGLENRALAKVSLGAEQTMGWRREQSTVEAVQRLRAEGYVVVALECAADSVDIFALPATLRAVPRERIALVLGSETAGVSEAVVAKAHYVAAIPMRGRKESLNVSVAFGIVAYALHGSER